MIELPAGLRAEHTIVHPGPNGAVLVLGVEPLKIEGPPPGGGQVSVTSYIQWTTAIHLSPQALKHLRDQLVAVVEQWEAQMGPITVLAPAPPKPSLAVFNPEIVRKTDQPEVVPAPTYDGLDRATEVTEQTRQSFRDFWDQRVALFGSVDRQDRRPLSDECPQAEPAPSPSEPTP